MISELVGKYKVTFLIATPTFLQAYMRRCSPESFGSSAICPGRRGKAAGTGRAGIRRHLWHSAAGGLRLHRVLAGGDGERTRFPRAGISPGGGEAGQDRPSAARESP